MPHHMLPHLIHQLVVRESGLPPRCVRRACGAASRTLLIIIVSAGDAEFLLRNMALGLVTGLIAAISFAGGDQTLAGLRIGSGPRGGRPLKSFTLAGGRGFA